MNFVDRIKSLFTHSDPKLENKNIISPISQSDQLTNPALLNWYANQQSREELAHRQNQQRAINNYIPPTPTPTNIPIQAPKQTPWNDFAKLVIQEGNNRGYNGEVLARQKALESGFGTSNFAKERNNYGGIAAYDSNPNAALKFNSPKDYLNYYFNLIQNHYPEAYNNRANPEKYVAALKQGGYASDPNYVWKVMNTPVYR